MHDRPLTPEALRGMDPTGRFSDRASDYVRHRPDYPAIAFDAMLEGLGAPESLLAADVGAGTGISTRPLAERGVRVVAIEPNAAMRAAAEPHANVAWRDGSAEATGLPDACVDLVLCAQAFHWFRQAEALAEFRRVLRSGGRFALMWNVRDDSDALTREYIEAIHATNGVHASERIPFDPATSDQVGGFGPVGFHAFPHEQALDRDGLLGRATSSSYVSREPAKLEALTRLLHEAFERHRDARGLVTMRYVTEVWMASRL